MQWLIKSIYCIIGYFLVLFFIIRYHKYVVKKIALTDHLLAKRRQSLFSTFSFLHIMVLLRYYHCTCPYVGSFMALHY
jgi:hypothetical protein